MAEIQRRSRIRTILMPSSSSQNEEHCRARYARNQATQPVCIGTCLLNWIPVPLKQRRPAERPDPFKHTNTFLLSRPDLGPVGAII